ncbi:MAG: SBBP repeat-containing protein [Promethearchaeota archaeon]
MKIRKILFLLFILLLFNIYIPPRKFNLLDQDYKEPSTSAFHDPVEPEWNFTWETEMNDCSVGISVDKNDNIYYAGFYTNVDNYDMFLFKFNKYGVKQWNISWGGPERDLAHDVITDSEGNVYVVGSTNSYSVGSSDICLLKFDHLGSLIWNITWGGSNIESGSSIALDSSENLVITGETRSFGAGDFDICVVKFDKSGTQLWNQTWGNNQLNRGFDVALDTLDNIYVVGSNYLSNLEMVIVKFNSTGGTEWSRTWDLRVEDSTWATSTIIDNNGDIYVTGTAYRYYTSRIFLAKYNSNGDQLWVKTWLDGSTGGEYLARDSFGNIYVAGDAYNDAVVVKFNSSGNYLWNITWGGSGDDWASGVAFDSEGSIYLTGQLEAPEWKDEIFLLKYNPPPRISINTPSQNKFYGINAPEYNIAMKIYIGILNQCYYSLNDGMNYSFTTTQGVINQSAWESCSNGTVSIKFYVNDSSSNIGMSEVIVQKDINLPLITIYDPLNNQIFGANSPDFNISIYDVDLDTSWYFLNESGPFFFIGNTGKIDQLGWDLYESSSIKITFYANNSVGNTAHNVVYVMKYLAIDINEPFADQYFGSIAPYYNISLLDWGLYEMKYSLNDGRNYSITNPIGKINETAWDLLNDGVVKITFYADYLSVIKLEKSVSVNKDTVSPTISINLPIQYQIYGNYTLNLFYDITVDEESVDSIWYSLNSGDNYTVSDTFGRIDQVAWDFCENGSVLIRFYVNDSLGNTAYDEVIVVKDYNVLVPRNAYAIVIGVEDYPGTDYDLDYSRDDAESIYNFLTSECNYNSENIIFLVDSNATNSNINNAFSYIYWRINPEDVFFFFFSGHGGDHIDWGEYLCPYDSINPFNPSHCYFDYVLEYRLDNLPCSEKYIIIDCCYSGGMIAECQATGRYIMTSCMDDELCYETPTFAHGIFTYFFLNSFGSAVDSNGDGVISLEEQYPFVYTNTYQYSGGDSHPQESDQISGESVLYPTFGSLSLDVSGNYLNYSFYLYGHGLLNSLTISICSVTDNIVMKVEDLTLSTLTYSGFEFYSGSIQLEENKTITGYEIFAEIEGYDIIIFQEIYGDYDGDGLPDILEIREGINPREIDTDFDGLTDYEEFYGITDPRLNDTDFDGMLDGYEVNNGLNPLYDDSLLDLDNDGLLNIQEYLLGTYANNPDTDGDGMYDGYEYQYGLDLFHDDSSLDPDNDGLTNYQEFLHNTNPHLQDTDGDGWNDGDEVERGTDPLDPNDYPRLKEESILGYNILYILGLLGIISIMLIKKIRIKNT